MCFAVITYESQAASGILTSFGQFFADEEIRPSLWSVGPLTRRLLRAQHSLSKI